MANKQALRELQSRLAERLQAARSAVRGISWLAVECSGRGFLLPLKEAGEIFALAPVLPVPHSHGWFLGVKAPAGADGGREQSRLVGFNASLGINCVLMVDRLSGLRSDDQMTRDADPATLRPAFAGACLHDADGRPWQELNLAALAGDETFLKIVG